MLIEIKNLTVFYGAVRAIHNVSVSVGKGELVAFLGPNGAGKSTTLKAICGLLEMSGGEIKDGDIFLNGVSIKNIPTYDLVFEGISIVPEGRRVFPSMSVAENLRMGAYIKKNKEEIINAYEKIYCLFPMLKERQKQRAGTLSSGEQQMLSIGRALMLEPQLLLLDEPSLGLSPNYIEVVFEKIKEINQYGTTIIIVEQNARMALEYAHRGYIFKIGEIALSDKTENLLQDDQIKKSFLGI